MLMFVTHFFFSSFLAFSFLLLPGDAKKKRGIDTVLLGEGGRDSQSAGFTRFPFFLFFC